ncbi:uncharacterized protein S101395_03409 [Bacillus sonorensis]|uniref:Uncharacterized protein n=1 Tax=Bacillus sonorensis TaxID=119858 RepID=A0ABN5AH37_9BACI|nr:uncharacterized protein S101395_03409 [Bacillus sonorensis]
MLKTETGAQTAIQSKENRETDGAVEKNQKSKDMQHHKKPMNKKVLQEEFSGELGDVNAFKFIDVIEQNKKKKKKQAEQDKQKD